MTNILTSIPRDFRSCSRNTTVEKSYNDARLTEIEGFRFRFRAVHFAPRNYLMIPYLLSRCSVYITKLVRKLIFDYLALSAIIFTLREHQVKLAHSPTSTLKVLTKIFCSVLIISYLISLVLNV